MIGGGIRLGGSPFNALGGLWDPRGKLELYDSGTGAVNRRIRMAARRAVHVGTAQAMEEAVSLEAHIGLGGLSILGQQGHGLGVVTSGPELEEALVPLVVLGVANGVFAQSISVVK